MTKDSHTLTGRIIGCAMRVHSVLGPGFVESVYRRALAHELHKEGVTASAGCPVTVRYDGVEVGTFVADLLVEGEVILELKACVTLAPAHEAQLVNYLVATGIDVGLLLNFGAQRLEFRRKHRIYRPSATET